MVTYLNNAVGFFTTAKNARFTYSNVGKKVSEVKKVVDEAIKNNSFVNAVGHQSTANILAKILEIPVKTVDPKKRTTINLQKNDILIGIRFFKRLPEGVVLTEQELNKIGYEFVIVTRTE